MANGLKLEGQRFGHLTVLKKLDERENRYVVWLCTILTEMNAVEDIYP